MAPRIGPIDDDPVGILEHGLVAIGREIPQRQLVALADFLPLDLIILRRGAAHMRERSLPADDLLRRIGDQIGIALQLRALVGKLRSEEHTSELQSLMRISYAVFCLKKKKPRQTSNSSN